MGRHITPILLSNENFWSIFTLYFIIPRIGSSTQSTENRTTLELSFLISQDVSTNSIVINVKVFIKQRTYLQRFAQL